jgi:hypothetical protein
LKRQLEMPGILLVNRERRRDEYSQENLQSVTPRRSLRRRRSGPEELIEKLGARHRHGGCDARHRRRGKWQRRTRECGTRRRALSNG